MASGVPISTTHDDENTFLSADDRQWTFTVEDQVFVLPIDLLARGCKKFHLLRTIRQSEPLAGSDIQHAIPLDGTKSDGTDKVTKREFQSLVSYLIGRHWSETSAFSPDILVDVLRLAILWEFPDARWSSLRELDANEQFKAEHAKVLRMACEYHIISWVERSFVALAGQPTLDTAQFEELGVSLATHVITCRGAVVAHRMHLLTGGPRPAEALACSREHGRFKALSKVRRLMGRKEHPCAGNWPKLWKLMMLRMVDMEGCICSAADMCATLDTIRQFQATSTPESQVCDQFYLGVIEALEQDGVLRAEAKLVGAAVQDLYFRYDFDMDTGDDETVANFRSDSSKIYPSPLHTSMNMSSQVQHPTDPDDAATVHTGFTQSPPEFGAKLVEQMLENHPEVVEEAQRVPQRHEKGNDAPKIQGSITKVLGGIHKKIAEGYVVLHRYQDEVKALEQDLSDAKDSRDDNYAFCEELQATAPPTPSQAEMISNLMEAEKNKVRLLGQLLTQKTRQTQDWADSLAQYEVHATSGVNGEHRMQYH
ncbi:hypothetical protein EUX98_g1099 [Antrodiella citrinella]|uniref:BTB domain-containing protein n=1 Tax=Antrodiella citrinella TaxID=2447956 RepID=A0A4S4N2C5_9APHY|nr:hypothetical protein EUX98_g1099 [Antrodiella citrinella]